MFIILPFQHDKMSVRRLPWVSISLLVLNALVFFALYPEARSNQREVESVLDEVYDYWAGNPFVEMTEAFEEVFSPPVSHLRELVGGTLEPPDPEMLAAGQAEFEVLMSKALSVAAENPYHRLGYRPAEASLLALLTSMFIHGGWMHLLGNMLFLYLSAPFIEDLWGRAIFLLFYLAGGTAATLTHAYIYPDSTIALIGASGAIAAVMGAFLIRLAKTRIQFFYCYIIIGIRWGTFHSPAWIMLPLWLSWQWWMASLAGTSTGVAFWAHIGGFLFGAAAGAGMKISKIEERFIRPKIDAEVSHGGDRRLDEALELREEGEHEKALALFREVLREKPESLEARGGVFETALKLEEKELANKEAVPLLERCVRGGRPDLALRYFEEMEALTALKFPPRLLFALAGAQEKAEEGPAAITTYRRLVDEHPRDVLTLKSLLRIAEIDLASGNRVSAEEVLLRAHSHPLATAEWQKVVVELEEKCRGSEGHNS